jgi:hypothetical protein
MIATEAAPALDRLLDPVTRCLTPEAMKELVNLRADANFQEHLDKRADKNTEGQLCATEREEYEIYVRAIQVISILQAKARKLLGVQLTQQRMCGGFGEKIN